MSAMLEVPLRFSDMAVGDVNPFTFDFGTDWAAPGDPVTSATVTTSSPDQLSIIGGPGVQNNQVTVWLSGGCANTEYLIFCTVQTQYGRKATRTAHLYVTGILPV